MSTPVAEIRWEDLNNRPGLEMNGFKAVLVPYESGAGNVKVSFNKGVVYTCLLKKTIIATDGVLPDQSAVDFAAEAAGDMLLVVGKITQGFV